MIEFESTALMIGQLGVRVSLIAYPVVSIKKARRRLRFKFAAISVFVGCTIVKT